MIQAHEQHEIKQAGGAIIVLGEALLDVFPTRTVVGGAPFNVACSASAVGADVCLVTRLGADANGDLVRTEAARFGVRPTGLQTDNRHCTGTVQVKITGSENHYTIATNQAWDYLDLPQALAATQAMSASYLYFGTLAQRSTPSRDTIRYLAAHFTGLVYLDLNLRDMPDIRAICEDSLNLADIVKVNEEELRTLFAWFGESQAVEAASAPWQGPAFQIAVAWLTKKFALTGLLVTRGQAGYAYFDEQGALEVAGKAVANVVVADTVGAGDSFSAMFLASQARGLSLDESLTRSAELAAAVCGIHGAVPASRDFYARWRASDIGHDVNQPERHAHG